MSHPTGPDAIVAGIQALHAERAQAAARIAEIDATLAAIAAQALQGTGAAQVAADGTFRFSEPAPPAPAADEEDAAADPSDALHATKTAVLAALKKTRTPMRPKDLATMTKRDRTTLRYAIQELEEEGLVTATGATANRRIALA